MIIVERSTDKNEMKKLKPPLLIYGRRKTGKTFFVKSLFGDSYYFFVKRDRSIYFENRNEVINYREMIRIMEEFKEKMMIVDEFHRLPGDFLDWLHIRAPTNILLITSTLHLAKKLIGKHSPVLGLFLEYQMTLIDERDILINLEKHIKEPKRLVEMATYLREPILLRWFNKDLLSVLKHLKLVVPALVGEIFSEEDKELSARYEGILRALSTGKGTLSEVASMLHSYNLIEKQDIASIKPYVNTLIELSLVKRIPEYFGKRFYYFISSPMIDLYYYLDEKYNFSEADISDRCMIEKIPLHVEDFFRSLFSKLFRMRTFIINKPEMEVDIVLVEFKKLKVVAEIKWKNNVSRSEIKRAEEKLKKFKDCKKILIVPEISVVEKEPKEIEIWDVKRILEEIKRIHAAGLV